MRVSSEVPPMKVCMVFYDMQEFGGLEEYAVALAIGLEAQNHHVSVFSCAWIPPHNQYLARLRDANIHVIQPPKWVSLPVSDWPTKERIVEFLLSLVGPLVYLLGFGLGIVKKRSFKVARQSARNWLQGQFLRIIGPDWRKSIAKPLLSIWKRVWNPDVMHLQGYTTNLLFAIEWGYRNNVPVVYEEHQTPDPMFNWWQNVQVSLNRATIVVAVSEKSAEALREVCGVTQPISVRSPLMVDPQNCHNGKPSGLQDKVFTVSTFARLYETKGLNFLLDTAAQVRARYADIVFKVYGDGPLRDKLLAYASDLGLDGSSIFVGAFNHWELSDIMAQTDVFLMSSVLEGQPLALVEAMAYGCPIVATKVGGIPELIQDGVNGYLCPPRDPACLADKVIMFYENPSLREQMGVAARGSYEQGPFQPDAVSQELTAIYREAVQLKKNQ